MQDNETKLMAVSDDTGKLYGWTAIRGETHIGIVRRADDGGYTVFFDDRTQDHCSTLDEIRAVASAWIDSRKTREAEKVEAQLNRLQDRILALAIEISESDGISDAAKTAIDGELATARTAVIVASTFAAAKSRK